jgi:hypothetical protein
LFAAKDPPSGGLGGSVGRAGFNGARLCSPGKTPDLTTEPQVGTELQWGPALFAGKDDYQLGCLLPSSGASMGPGFVRRERELPNNHLVGLRRLQGQFDGLAELAFGTRFGSPLRDAARKRRNTRHPHSVLVLGELVGVDHFGHASTPSRECSAITPCLLAFWGRGPDDADVCGSSSTRHAAPMCTAGRVARRTFAHPHFRHPKRLVRTSERSRCPTAGAFPLSEAHLLVGKGCRESVRVGPCWTLSELAGRVGKWCKDWRVAGVVGGSWLGWWMRVPREKRARGGAEAQRGIGGSFLGGDLG